jgi:predicted dehydrogenase
VRAILSKIVKERPDGRGGIAPCLTWDNATLFCEAADPARGEPFPLTLKLQRIAPGQKNTWYLEVFGTQASARFTTRAPNRLELLEFTGGDQTWREVQTGHETAFKTITGAIFEFGMPDAILQMWAAFVHELVHGQPRKKFAGCATPEEAALSHRLFTAALGSQKGQCVVPVSPSP